MTAPTWHYGVTAHYWAEFNTDGPEIDYFRGYVEAAQPALDLGCGTGRLLLPYLRDGLDVDGCDVSADMLARCREAAEREGLTPSLYAQPKHELDLPRRYRTIFMCGALGVGSTRAEDLEAMRRVYDHLEPGGMFVVDNEVPYFKDEIVLMLERAGFVDVTVRAALTDAEPTAADDFLVFTARRPAALPSSDGRG